MSIYYDCKNEYFLLTAFLQVEYPDNVFFYSQFPQEKELKGEIIELDSIFFRYPFRVRVEGDKEQKRQKPNITPQDYILQKHIQPSYEI